MYCDYKHRERYSMFKNTEKLKELSKEELQKIWIKTFNIQIPKDLNKSYLIKHIAWQQKYGGINASTQKQLDKLVEQYAKNKVIVTADIKKIKQFSISQGTKLLREFRGNKYEVLALEKGFSYSGRYYKSLSAIANEITGTRWNGKKFFGVA